MKNHSQITRNIVTRCLFFSTSVLPLSFDKKTFMHIDQQVCRILFMNHVLVFLLVAVMVSNFDPHSVRHMAVVRGGKVAVFGRDQGRYLLGITDFSNGCFSTYELQKPISGMAEVLMRGKPTLALSYR